MVTEENKSASAPHQNPAPATPHAPVSPTPQHPGMPQMSHTMPAQILPSQTDGVCPHCQARTRTNINNLTVGNIANQDTWTILQCVGLPGPGASKGCGRRYSAQVGVTVTMKSFKIEGQE